MIVSFIDPLDGEKFEIDFVASANAVRHEFEARKPDENALGGYGPSQEFNRLAQRTQKALNAYTRYMFNKMEQGGLITDNDIENSKKIESLVIQSKSGPNGNKSPNTQMRLRKLNNGYGVRGQKAEYKIIKIAAKHKRLLSSSPALAGQSVGFKAQHFRR